MVAAVMSQYAFIDSEGARCCRRILHPLQTNSDLPSLEVRERAAADPW